MDVNTLVGIFRLFILDLVFPTLATYIVVEIGFHLFADAIRGRQEDIG